MAGDGSAYAALGLEPGADAAAIERAYKTLIKRYHPDRADGDAGRATEIIHAYRELRAGSKDALEFNDFDPLTGQPRLGWVGIALAVVGAILIFVVLAGSLSRLTEVPSFPLGKIPAAAAVSDAMDRPLVAGSIDRAVSDAVRIN